MYSAIDLIKQEIKEMEQKWNRYNPHDINEIERLIQKREHDAKLVALAKILYVLEQRNTMPVLTKENTEVKWMPADNEYSHPYAIMRSGDFELTFDNIGISWAHVANDNDYFTDISLCIENNFARHDFDGIVPAFFIEKSFLSELSNLADDFMECEECGFVLSGCQCCGECGKYECECDYCEYCGERDCDGECQEEDDDE